MLSVGGSTRVFIATGPTDMRLGFNGLHALIEGRFRRPPLSGDYYVFANRHRNRIKIFFYDSGGLCIFTKRLEASSFRWPDGGETVVTVTHAELQLLLSGIDLSQTKRRRWWQPVANCGAAVGPAPRPGAPTSA